MKLKIAFLFVLIALMTACESNPYLFRGNLGPGGGVMGTFTVRHADAYSVVIESYVYDSDDRRREVVEYFDARNYRDVLATLSIYKNNGGNSTLIKKLDVTKPGCLRWVVNHFFDLISLKMEKGSYELKMNFSGLSRIERSYINRVVVQSTYHGK